MMANPQIARIRAFWDQLSQNQRIAVAGVAITAVLAIALLLLLRPPQRYETAFSGLAGDDAASIVADLRDRSIPYELTSDGSTIRVPPEHVADVRLAAAAKGLPKGGGAGFELFDKSSFGLTDFTQRVNYQRAIEGELQRTINRIDAVAASRVHIVIPEESLFTDKQQPTTAAVVLELKPGQRLSEAQVRGITHLVSGSVPNLHPEDLSIIDSAGNPIWDGGAGGSHLAGLDDAMRTQQEYEARLEQRLQTLISEVTGNGHAAVRVNAVLNWDQRSTESEIFSPDGTQPQVRSQQEHTMTQSGTGSEAGGPPGVNSNVQTFQEGDPESTGSTFSERDVTTNYEISRRVEQTVVAPGQVQRLSVAVVLDGNHVEPAVAQEIQSIVTAAAGIIPQRGDTITVSAVPFSDLGKEQITAPTVPLWERALQALKILALILVPIAALLIARRVLTQQREEPAELGPEVDHTWHGYPQPQVLSFATADEPILEPTPLRSEALIRQEMLALAAEEPAQLVQLIRTWMNEDE